jgi:hypothetical protein
MVASSRLLSVPKYGRVHLRRSAPGYRAIGASHITISGVDEAWIWVERLSWVVAIVGIPSLVLGLFTLVRRPSVEVGFFPLHRDRRFLRRIDRPSNETFVPKKQANPMTLRFVVANVGRASAREVLVNLAFPTLTLDQVSVPAGAPKVIQHPNAAYPLWAYHIDYVHPGVQHLSEVHLRGTDLLAIIPIEYEVSMSDVTAVRGSCRVVVSQSSSSSYGEAHRSSETDPPQNE